MSAGLLFESSFNGGRPTLFPDDPALDSRPMMAHAPLRVDIVALPAHDALAAEWRALEARADHSFFTSWWWIGSLLRTLPGTPGLRLVRAIRGPDTVGLALINLHKRPWRGGLSMCAMFLNATGDADLDRITAEHNDVLCDRHLAPAVRRAVVDALCGQARDWDELHLPGVSPQAEWHRNLPNRLVAQVREEACYCVDLAAVRSSPGPATLDSMSDSRERYLGTLSSNTRAQIRRSLKEYGKLGAVSLTVAASVEQAGAYLHGLRELHQRYWTARGEPGAFGHPFFERFHLALIESAFASGQIQLIRMQAGEHVVGYLYNFVHRGRVLNYQSGFDYSIAEKHGRPGLVVQALAVALNADRGASVYDFMAGANRSKESLATTQYAMDWIVLRRLGLKSWLDDRLRGAKRQWARRRQPVAGVAGAAAERSDKSNDAE